MTADADLAARSAPLSRETAADAAAPPLTEGESSVEDAELAVVAPRAPAREEAA